MGVFPEHTMDLCGDVEPRSSTLPPRGRPAPWPPERLEALAEAVRGGLSGREIAALLGVTRSAVLGMAYRRGIRLPMDARKSSLRGRGRPAKPKAAPGQTDRRYWKFGRDHPCRVKGREAGSRAFSDEAIASAIATHLAGMSGRRAARSIGASWQSLRSWERTPELMALGRALFERAHADAAERAALRLAAQAARAEAERQHRDLVNAPILAAMPERHRAMMLGRIAGQTLQEVGSKAGVTRERVRQIEVKWRLQGLLVPGTAEISPAARASFEPKPPRARKDPAERGPDRRRREHMSPEARARRSEAARARMNAQWAKIRVAMALAEVGASA